MSYSKGISIIATLLLPVVVGAEARADTARYDDHIFSGQTLQAPSCYYHLDMQSDGNLVIYASQGRHTPTWATGTVGSGAYAVMQADGNLVVYNWNNVPVWASGTNGHWWSLLNMQDDGNLVIYDGRGAPLWASGTNGESVGQTCWGQSRVTSVERDYNRFGGDYVYYEIDHNWPEACEYWCSQDYRCQAYTHVPAGVQGPKARCWLKNTVPPRSSAPGLVSGYIHH